MQILYFYLRRLTLYYYELYYKSWFLKKTQRQITLGRPLIITVLNLTVRSGHGGARELRVGRRKNSESSSRLECATTKKREIQNWQNEELANQHSAFTNGSIHKMRFLEMNTHQFWITTEFCNEIAISNTWVWSVFQCIFELQARFQHFGFTAGGLNAAANAVIPPTRNRWMNPPTQVISYGRNCENWDSWWFQCIFGSL